jgi:hypothetical protein
MTQGGQEIKVGQRWSVMERLYEGHLEQCQLCPSHRWMTGKKVESARLARRVLAIWRGLEPELAEPLLVTTVMLDSWLDCALSIPFHEARKVLLLRLVLSTSGIARC